jgi:flagellar biosynthesis protein FliQ
MLGPADLIDIAREGLIIALMLSLPILGAAALASLVSAALQAFTRVSEPALTTIPRIVAVGLAVLAAAPWIGHRLAGFATRVWSLVHDVAIQ